MAEIIMRSFIPYIFIVAIFCACPAWADEAKDIANIRERLDQLELQEQPDSIKATAVQGLYEVIYGTEVFYLSEDGRYVLQNGSLLDLETGKNLTELARAGIRKELMRNLDESQMIVFSPDKPRYTLTVFTDIDCGYCRKLHREIDQLNSYGIKIRYMMFPRSGVNAPSYKKAVSVWCSEDQQTSLTRAKAGEDVPPENCNHPVSSQLLTGQRLGVTGTPALFMEDGTLIPGYRPAKDLAAIMDATASN